MATIGGDAELDPVADDDRVLMVYTSGTAGRPKGVALSQANCFWTNLSLTRTVPSVTEAAVVSRVDERSGKVGVAFVVPRASSAVSAAELAVHCRAELAGFKVPREFRFVDELPHSSLGKILRRALREAAAVNRGLST